MVVRAVFKFLNTIGTIRTSFSSEVYWVVLKFLPAMTFLACFHLEATSFLISSNLVRLVPVGAVHWIVRKMVGVTTKVLGIMGVYTVGSLMTGFYTV